MSYYEFINAFKNNDKMAKIIGAITELDREFEGTVNIRSLNYTLKLIIPEFKDCNLIPIFEKFSIGN